MEQNHIGRSPGSITSGSTASQKPTGTQPGRAPREIAAFERAGHLPDARRLPHLYKACANDPRSLRILGQMQRQYEPEQYLVFDMFEPDDAHALLKKWTQCGLLVSLRVDLDHQPNREALKEYLPSENCPIRHLMVVDGYYKSLFGELAEAMGRNKSVSLSRLSGAITSNDEGLRSLLKGLASSGVSKLILEDCLNRKMDGSLIDLMQSGTIGNLVVSEFPDGMLAAVKDLQTAGKKCHLQHLTLKLTDNALKASLGAAAHYKNNKAAPDTKEQAMAMKRIPQELAFALAQIEVVHLTLSAHFLFNQNVLGALHLQLENALHENHSMLKIDFHPTDLYSREKIETSSEAAVFKTLTTPFLQRNRQEYEREQQRLLEDRV